MTDREIRKLFERVMKAMLKVGMIHRFTFTKGKGFQITWTTEGALAAIALKQWNGYLRATETDDGAGILDKLVRGFAFLGDRSEAAIGSILERLRHSGFATLAVFTEGDVPRIAWTPRGLAFRDAFIRIVDDLKLSTDYDGLMALFHIAEGWAPDAETPVVSR